MRIAIIADCYSPMKSSAAVMLEDLASEMYNDGHSPVVFIPDFSLETKVSQSLSEGVRVVRISSFKTKDINFARRAFAEFLMPFMMSHYFNKHFLDDKEFDAVIWYSPSIFHAPFVNLFKKKYKCKSYLILRDIFPEWAVNLGVMKKGLPYKFFKQVEKYQYSVADRIGVQSHANLNYFKSRADNSNRKTEVLNNWMTKYPNKVKKCSIDLSTTSLRGRKIFVYPGNMGKAQNISPFFNIICKLNKKRNDIGFVFVGRGSESQNLKNIIQDQGLTNALVFGEIPNNEITALYDQCHFGMVFLDPRHKTHNIPGKFISYMHHSLPVIACINAGNDLHQLIKKNNLGFSFLNANDENILTAISEMVDNSDFESQIPANCLLIANKVFSSSAASRQICSFFYD